MIYPIALGLVSFAAGATAGTGAWCSARKMAAHFTSTHQLQGVTRDDLARREFEVVRGGAFRSTKERALAAGGTLLLALAVNAVAISALSLTTIPLGIGAVFVAGTVFGAFSSGATALLSKKSGQTPIDPSEF